MSSPSNQRVVEAILHRAYERRARGLKHDTVAHAALFDGANIRVEERDGTVHVGSPVIAPGAWESIGVRTPDGIEWFNAASVAQVEAVTV